MSYLLTGKSLVKSSRDFSQVRAKYIPACKIMQAVQRPGDDVKSLDKLKITV
jgi:hypothetical protein